MSTVTTFLTGQALSTGAQLGGRSHHAENVLDFSETNVSSADVIQALKLPAGALVKTVWCECLTAEGATATANIGDATDPDGWDATINLNSAAGVISGDGAYVGGKRYAAADTIDVVPTADLDTAKMRIVAEYIILEQS